MIAHKLKQTELRIWHILWMLVVWIALWGKLNLANLITGLVVAIGISLALPMPKVPITGSFHIWPVMKLIYLFFQKLLVASFQVTLLAYSRKADPQGKIFDLPYSISSEMILAVYIDYMNLIPGTMILGINRKNRILKLHILDASNPQKTYKNILGAMQLENLFIKAFANKTMVEQALQQNLTNQQICLQALGASK